MMLSLAARRKENKKPLFFQSKVQEAVQMHGLKVNALCLPGALACESAIEPCWHDVTCVGGLRSGLGCPGRASRGELD
eukprot:839686-Pleurochrysis_carterae.AAC.1